MADDLGNMSTTAASNTSVGGVSIAEGMIPGNVNNGMRAIIAQSKGALLAVTSSGTDTITATYAPAPTAYVSGWLYPFKAGGTNTGATTFNANSIGAKDVKAIIGGAAAALTGGEIVSGGFYTLRYDGTDMILENPSKVTSTGESTDYAEGSWTPTIAGSSTAGAQTYSTQVGRYVRMGNLVWISASAVMSAKDATTAGNIEVRGIPFTSSNVTSLKTALSVEITNIDLSSGKSQFGALLLANSAVINITEMGDNVADANLQAAALQASSAVVVTGSYFIG